MGGGAVCLGGGWLSIQVMVLVGVEVVVGFVGESRALVLLPFV